MMATSKHFGLVQHMFNNCSTDKQEARNKHSSSMNSTESENTIVCPHLPPTGLGAIRPILHSDTNDDVTGDIV